MRVGLFSDLHGNTVALDAVLRRLEDVDEIVCLGDIAYGPMPVDTLASVRQLGCPVVAGNAEVWLGDPATLDTEPLFQPRRLAAHRQNHSNALEWIRGQLSDEDMAYMRDLPHSLDIALPGGRTLHCYHASPRHYFEFLLPTTPAVELEAMVRGVDAEILAGGHTHQQMLRYHHDKMILNVGSAGRVPSSFPWPSWWPQADELSRDAGGPEYRASAEFAILEVTETRVGVSFEQVALDPDAIEEMLALSAMPNAANYFGPLSPFAS